MKERRLSSHDHLQQKHLLFLSYYFTKNRPSKIFKIEKFNRQTLYKNGLILPKKMSFQVKTFI